MHQFFVEPKQIQGKEILITGGDASHISHVLRMKPGEEISVKTGVDGKEYRCGIEEITDAKVRCSLRFIKEDAMELPAKIYLFQALSKAGKMEFIIQKAVELGVYAIIPVSTKRAIVKLDEKKAQAKCARWQALSEAAAKQSRRSVIPKVMPVMTMQQAADYASAMDVKLIPYELADGMSRTRSLIQSIQPGQSVAVFIGPEGGFEEAEIEAAKNAGILPVTLGKRILRTETAGMAVLAWIMYHMEQ